MLTSLEDAKNYKIGVLNQDSSHLRLLSRGFSQEKNLDLANTEEANVKKLMGGRVDLIVQNDISLAERMKSLGLPFSKLEKLLPLYKEEQHFCMAFGQKTPDKRVNQVRDAFEQLKAEGMPGKTFEKYLKKYE